MKLMEIKGIVSDFMKRTIFFLLVFLGTMICHGQTIDWSKTRNWRIYSLNNKEAYFYPVDTLKNFKSVAMSDSNVISYLSRGRVWEKGKGATWMGIYIASYETIDKDVRKVVISSYGGFLFDSQSQRYYELPKELRKDWNDFIMENLKLVFEE